MSLQQQFVNYSKFGDTRSDGKTITLTNTDKWMKQAQLIDGKRITTTDTGIAFNKFKSRTIDFEQFLAFLEDLAERKNVDLQEMQDLMAGCGLPGTTPARSESERFR